jgi:hypothetical protein
MSWNVLNIIQRVPRVISEHVPSCPVYAGRRVQDVWITRISQEYTYTCNIDIIYNISCFPFLVSLRYTNDGSNPIEAVYTFPLEADAVLKAFTYTIDGKKTVVGQARAYT